MVQALISAIKYLRLVGDDCSKTDPKYFEIYLILFIKKSVKHDPV